MNSIRKPIFTGAFVWLCLLILSFSYDRSVVTLTQYDKLNPRLFDFMVLLGLMLVLPAIGRRMIMPKSIKIWSLMVFWCGVCTLVTVVFYEANSLAYSSFSIYYWFKYMEGVICIFIICKMGISEEQKRVLGWFFVLGGIFVSTYSAFEYSGAISGSRTISVIRDLEVGVYKSSVFGPLSFSYFHVGSQACLVAAVFLGISEKMKWFLRLPIFLFLLWPALVCGSRSFFIGGLFLILVFMFSGKLSKYIYAAFLLLVVVVVYVNFGEFNETVGKVSEYSPSLDRLIGQEKQDDDYNTIASRTKMDFSWENSKHGLPLAAFFGTGFAISPVIYPGGYDFYRVGYGIHNMYFFMLEQAGIPGFLLALGFFITYFISIRKTAKYGSPIDREFAKGTWYFYVILLTFAYPGPAIWHFVSTTNFSNFLIVVLTLALISTDPRGTVKSRAVVVKTV